MSRFLCCLRKNKTIKKVYVLKLENDRYYVGESISPDTRIQNHFKGKGSAWTRLYKPIEVLTPMTPPQKDFWELSETIKLMSIYGVDNVRGSLFTKTSDLTYYEKVMAAQLYCELNNLCRKCGGSDHFINQCVNLNKESWIYQFGGVLEFGKVKHLTSI
tara:strand:- start:917 stop:1393 length:477 start_codon:yes stop_codon:yes gene_type:complete